MITLHKFVSEKGYLQYPNLKRLVEATHGAHIISSKLNFFI